MAPSLNFTDTNATGFGNFNTPDVTMAANDDSDVYTPAGAMQHDQSSYAEADMVDADEHYGSDDQLGQAPYFSGGKGKGPEIDPRLANLLNNDMANINLQNGEEDVSPQAYAGDVSSEDRTPTKPKRAPAKSAKKGKKKQAVVDEVLRSSEDDEPENENDEDFEPEEVVSKKVRKQAKGKAAPKTPKSKTKTPTKTRKSTRKSAGKVNDDLPFNRQRRPPKNGITESRVIPRSYEECDKADKTLIDMRNKDQMTWKDIRVVWEEMTGQKTGQSTLPNRYERLKDNFSVIREEDRPHLLEAKDEVERTAAEIKWGLIAAKVKQKGGESYSADNLQRQYRKMMVKEGLRPPPGIVDPDFSIAISEDDEEDDDDE